MNVEPKSKAGRYSFRPACGPAEIASLVEAQTSGEVGHVVPQVGKAGLRVTVEGAQWIGFLNGQAALGRMLPTRKLRLKGPPRLLAAFGRRVPS